MNEWYQAISVEGLPEPDLPWHKCPAACGLSRVCSGACCTLLSLQRGVFANTLIPQSQSVSIVLVSQFVSILSCNLNALLSAHSLRYAGLLVCKICTLAGKALPHCTERGCTSSSSSL